jgi:hypothetical protein
MKPGKAKVMNSAPVTAVELPALRRDLTGAPFKQQTNAADDEIHEHQFGQPQRE